MTDGPEIGFAGVILDTSSRASSWLSDSCDRLIHLYDLIYMHILHGLHNATRPVNLQCLNYGHGPESEMYALIARREIATRGCDRRVLCTRCGHHLHLGAY